MIDFVYICDSTGFEQRVKQHPGANDPVFNPDEWIQVPDGKAPGVNLLIHRASVPAVSAAIPVAAKPAPIIAQDAQAVPAIGKG